MNPFWRPTLNKRKTSAHLPTNPPQGQDRLDRHLHHSGMSLLNLAGIVPTESSESSRPLTPTACCDRIHPTGGRSMLRLACLFAILVSANAPSVWAQNNQFGNIHGTVTDASGAQVPGVTVTLTSPALLAPQSTSADASGNYRFEQLPVGMY